MSLCPLPLSFWWERGHLAPRGWDGASRGDRWAGPVTCFTAGLHGGNDLPRHLDLQVFPGEASPFSRTSVWPHRAAREGSLHWGPLTPMRGGGEGNNRLELGNDRAAVFGSVSVRSVSHSSVGGSFASERPVLCSPRLCRRPRLVPPASCPPISALATDRGPPRPSGLRAWSPHPPHVGTRRTED